MSKFVCTKKSPKNVTKIDTYKYFDFCLAVVVLIGLKTLNFRKVHIMKFCFFFLFLPQVNEGWVRKASDELEEEKLLLTARTRLLVREMRKTHPSTPPPTLH